MAPTPTASASTSPQVLVSPRVSTAAGPAMDDNSPICGEASPCRHTASAKSSGHFMKHKAIAMLVFLVTFALEAQGQQMNPEQIRQVMQQQQNGGGGSALATPNRIVQLLSAAGAGSAALAKTARNHPRTAVATAAAATTAVFVGTETRRSGLLVCRSPRISLFKPSDAYLSRVLEEAADAPVSSPLRGVILSPFEDPERDEELADGHSESLLKRIGSTRGRRTVGSGRTKRSRHQRSSSARKRGKSSGYEDCHDQTVTPVGIEQVLIRAREVEAAGVYTEETIHNNGVTVKGGSSGKVKSACSGVRVGRGLALYHKFAQGFENLDVFDGRNDCELVAAESSSEGLGSTLGLLTRPPLRTWSLSPLRVVLLRETTARVPRAVMSTERSTGNSSRSSKRSVTDTQGSRKKGGNSKERSKRERSRSRKHRERKQDAKGDGGEGSEDEDQLLHRQFSLALSAVEGAGWSGTWLFRVTHDAETDEVWFQTSLSQRRGKFGTTTGGDLAARVKLVNEDMVKRGHKHAKVLKTRQEQYSRISSLSRSRARHAKELERDRILNPDKYKRVHRWMREDSHTTGGASARPARWGEERRKNDIRLK